MDYQDIQKLINIALDTYAQLLTVYVVYDEHGKVMPLIRHGKEYDGGYVVVEKSLYIADSILGYGIANDMSFEYEFSMKYGKPSFGFDKSSDPDKLKNVLSNPLCKLIQENIVSERLKQGITSNTESTFQTHIQRFVKDDLNVFLKMDIEGAEFDVFEDIYDYAREHVTGIVLEVHFYSVKMLLKAIDLLTNLKKHFILVHVHGNNCVHTEFSSRYIKGNATTVLELSFINKRLVSFYEISVNQEHPIPNLDMPNDPNKPDVHFAINVNN